jgi:dTDP-L-rhamnose 4-epimerase
VRILVTGAAGFIGSHVVDQLVAAGHDVVGVDALLPAAHDHAPDYLDPAVPLTVADLRDPEVARAAVQGVDAVCHQAAMVGMGVDLGDLPLYVGHNDLATAELLRALAAAPFAGRFVLASSMVVYGDGRYACPRHGVVTAPPRALDDLRAGRFDPRCPVCAGPLEPRSVPEDTAADPRSVYAATKLHQEHLVACFARERPGTTATFLRYHNVYGPRMPRDTPYAGVASIFRSSVEAGQAPQVFEDGAQLRDFVHVRDVARANVLALTAPEPVPGALNVASGRPRTILDMAQALVDAGPPGAPRPQTTGAFRAGDVRHVFASTDRAAQALGFRAQIGFADGIREFATAALR